MKGYFVFLFMPLLVFISCSVKPEPIDYGSDGCHFCSMTIVDQQHAAQIVTSKGKAFKFDAAECMMNYLRDMNTADVALYLTNTYHRPGELTDAIKATYLISENIPSPMGEFLTAFDSEEAAKNVQLESQGKLFTWQELKNKFDTKTK
ncbi:nitrous oxide reductase accessory protein NosL [uncultured Kriegella sp.]|uniref:nitrous oxide reductase accessory protein NosL n=1 Tax=uncultured Kriegella sp. TaxID=1798910 RepID=UPI0030D6D7A9|tara:strand:- start:34552 stop:34995 length:444 start_codon:yes stop_codon:yes gene_type:complete